MVFFRSKYQIMNLFILFYFFALLPLYMFAKAIKFNFFKYINYFQIVFASILLIFFVFYTVKFMSKNFILSRDFK